MEMFQAPISIQNAYVYNPSAMDPRYLAISAADREGATRSHTARAKLTASGLAPAGRLPAHRADRAPPRRHMQSDEMLPYFSGTRHSRLPAVPTLSLSSLALRSTRYSTAWRPITLHRKREILSCALTRLSRIITGGWLAHRQQSMPHVPRPIRTHINVFLPQGWWPPVLGKGFDH